MEDKIVVAQAFFNIGSQFLNQAKLERDKKKLEDARANFEDCLELREQAYPENHMEIVFVLDKLGETIYHMGDLEVARRHVMRSLKMQDVLQIEMCREISAAHIAALEPRKKNIPDNEADSDEDNCCQCKKAELGQCSHCF
jgi:tetratricopeptide (TPR) repeat protein